MAAEFPAVYEKGDRYYIGYCPHVPGANGQGEPLAACRASLREAIRLMLDDRAEDVLRGVPDDAVRETIVIP